MTQAPVPPSPRRPARDAAARNTTAAERTVKDRIFLLTRPRMAAAVPQYLDGDAMGFALCGKEGETKVGALTGRDRLPVVADLAHYETRVATADEPMIFPQTLFGPDGHFSEMITRTGSVAFTPTCYVEAGEPAGLKAIRAAAQQITRTDIIVTIAVDVTWLRDDKIDQFIAILHGIPHPIALILGGQYNPTDAYPSVMKNLRRLYQEIGRVGAWRTDPVTALDAMAHGALFAGIGSSGKLRHLVPPGQPTKSSGGGFKPSIFIPDLLAFARADTLTRRWANSEPLRCWCTICQGRPLDRFDSEEPDVDTEARAHNAAAWSKLWTQLRAQPAGAGRQRWLAEKIRAAHAACDAENERIQQPKEFKPSKTLAYLAKLAEAVPSPATEGSRAPAR